MIKFIIHIILAFSVFFSSSGFWMNKHFCQNELTKTSFLAILGSCCSSSTSPCSEDAEQMACSHEEQEDGCCENDPSFHKLDQDLLVAKTEFKAFKQFTPLHFLVAIKNAQIPVIDKSHLKYYNYVPPPIVIDRQVRLQTFLC